MKATLKLYASLTDFLPPGTRGNIAEIDVGEDESVAAITERFHLPQKMVHLVLVNGVFVKPEDRPSRTLDPGDALAIWPPVAGG